MRSVHTWHKADILFSQLVEEKLTEIVVAEKKAVLLKRGNALFAFAATCPHAGASLCNGWLDPRGHIVCPLHKYHFDPANGRNTSGEGYKLMTYPVEIKNDEIFIGLAERRKLF
jgi:nitrite reductase/ring-hydroxylating ferredoxin subunit